VTLAPEAGSARLRDVINKTITEEDLLVAASRFFDWGIMRIKLYFMLGLPTETDEDLLEIIRLAAKVRDFGRRRMHGRTPTVTVSVSTFVPKPFTPFAQEAMIDKTEIRRRQALLFDAGRAERLEVRTHGDGMSILEGVLCRGDASLADAIERAVDLGARFDGWSDQYRPDVWQEALKDVDVPGLLGPIPKGARVPWDHVSAGVNETYLQEELSRARQGLLTEPCGRFVDGDGDRFVCEHCGAGCKRGELPLRPPRVGGDISALKPPAPKPKGFPRPRTVEDGSEKKPVRIVLFMAKWGRQAFVGHLDTMRIVMRSLRRAGLELFYTQGFNPKPKMSSGPPLPLGISAMKDPIEVFLVDPPDDDTMMKRLAAACPEDFAFVGIERLPEGHKGLGRRIETARYVAQLRCDTAAAGEGVQRLLSASAIEVIREKDGKKQTVDIRPYIIGAEVLDRAPNGLLLPLAEDRLLVAFSHYIPGSGGPKPMEIVRAICPDTAQNARIVRTEVTLEPKDAA
jgi:radical SAM-linked protein